VSSRGAAVGIVALVAAAWPEIALACSVCSGGQTERTQLAFLFATLFMTLLPLTMIAGFGYVLWRRLRRLDAENAGADLIRQL
jgi:hypothetical protein